MQIDKLLAFTKNCRLNAMLAQRKSRAARKRLGLFPLESLESRRLLTTGWATLAATGSGPTYMEGLALLPDGSVMLQAGQGAPTNVWYQLSPKSTGNVYPGTTTATGNYVNGVWSPLPNSGTWMNALTANAANPSGSPEMRLYNNSVVLPDGRVFTIGGEYTSPDPFSGTSEIFTRATANTPASWKQTATIPTPPSSSKFNSNVITSASNTNPITITATDTTGLFNSEQVTINGVLGNTNANGTWTIANLTGTTFTLVGRAGNANYNPASTPTFTVSQFGDDPIEGLPGGKILAGSASTLGTYIYDPSTDKWSTTPINKLYDRSDEETWVKLRDGSILTYDIFQSITSKTFTAERFDPVLKQWVDASAVTSDPLHKPSLLSDGPPPSSGAFASPPDLQGAELGPAFLLPNGNVMFFGGNQHTAIYDDVAKTWSAGPDLPTRSQTGSITGASNVSGSISTAGASTGSPLVITTSSTAGLSNGDLVTIAGLSTNNQATNGNWYVQNLTSTTFQLALSSAVNSNLVAGTGTTTSGGSWFAGIKITTPSTVGLSNGELVTIGGVNGNTTANGKWTIVNKTATSFQLVGPKPNANFAAGSATWSTSLLAMADAPGCMMANGNILLDVSPAGGLAPGGGYSFPDPAYIYEFNPNTGSFTDVTPAAGISVNSYHAFMLALPSGQVLLDNASTGGIQIYTPSATPTTSLRPTISDITNNVDGTFTLTGTLLRGNSEGASYGDEGLTASDYPIVQFTDSSGKVTYSTTSNWDNGDSWTTATPPVTTTHFTAASANGADLLSVSANGINSKSVLFVQMGVNASNVTISVDPSNSSDVDVYQFTTLLGKFAKSSITAIDVNGIGAVNLDYSNGTFGVPINVNGVLAVTSLGFNHTGSINYTATSSSSGVFVINGDSANPVTVSNVNVQAVVTVQPHDLLSTSGESAVYTAAAYNTTGQALTAKWQFSTDSGANWTDDTADTTTNQTNSSGVTHTRLTFAVNSVSDRQYRAAFTSDGGLHYTYSNLANLHIATSVTYWVGGGRVWGSTEGDPAAWSEPLNWTNGVPGANTIAIFASQVPQYTRTNATGNMNLTRTAPVNTNSTVNGDYSIGGLFLSATWADTLTVNSSLVLSGSSEWDNGNINFGTQGAYVSNDPSSQLTMNNVNSLLLEGAGELVNYGTIVQTGSSAATHFLGIAGGTNLTNGSGGIFDMEVDGGISGQPGYASGSLINRGLLEKTGGTTTTGSTISTYFTNYGTIDVTQGELTIAPAGIATGLANYVGGNYFAEGGAVFDPTGGTQVTIAGTLDGGGAGQFAISHGTLLPATAGTTLNFPDHFFQWTGGTVGGDLTNTGYVTLAGNGQKLLAGTLHNQNTITETSDSLQIGGGALLENTTTATYNLASDGGISGQAGYATGSFLNRGFLVKSVGTNSTITTYFTTIVGLGGQGSIHVQHGTLVIAPAGVSSDLKGVAEPANYIGDVAGGIKVIFNVDAGTTIDPAGGTTVTAKGTLTGIGSGQVAFSQGSLNSATGDATFHFPTGMLQWTAGALNGTWANTAFVTLAGSGQKLLNGTLNNKSTMTQTTDSIQIAGGAVLDNQAGAFYKLASDGGIAGQSGYAAGGFFNHGTLQKISGTLSTGSTVTTYFTNSGKIELALGKLTIAAAGTVDGVANFNGGTLALNASAILDPTGGTTSTVAGTFTGAGGRVIFSQGTLLQAGAGAGAGATLNFPSGVFQWTGGAMNGTWTNVAFMTLAGSGQKLLNGTLHNKMLISQTTDSLQIAGGAVVDNQVGATYNLASDGGIAGQAGYSAGRFFNHGTLQKTVGSASVGSTVSSYFTNNGTLNLPVGKLTISAAGTADGVANFNGGSVIMSASATLDPTGGGTSTVSGTFTGSSGGHLAFSHGTLVAVDPGATFNFPTQVFQWTGGSLNGNWTNAAYLTLAGNGQKLLNGTLHNQNTITQTTDSLQIAGGAAFDNHVGATYTLASDGGISGQAGYAAGGFFNHGTLQKTAGTLTTGSPVTSYFTTDGMLNIIVGKLIIAPAGTADGIQNYLNGNILVSTGAVLDPTGGTTTIVSGNFIGTGVGHVTFSQGTLQAGTGATFNFPTGYFQWTAGAMTGTWTNAGDLTLAGTGQKLLIGTLNNQSIITQTTGSLQIAGGAVLDNQLGSIYNLTSDEGISGQAGYAAGNFNNAGTLLKSGGAAISSNTPSDLSAVFTNQTSGQIAVQKGSLQIDGDLGNTSTIIISPASRLVVNGNFSQGAAGKVDFQISGIPTSGLFGSMIVTPGHTATLGGTFMAELVNNFVAGAGNVFTVITYDTNAGTMFAHVIVPASLPIFVGPQSVTLGKNAAPVGASKTVTTLEDVAYTFKTADFGFSDASNNPANTLLAVKIKTLPAAGSLTDNGSSVTLGQFVPASDIASGNVKFTPAPNANGAAYARFAFQVQDDGGTAIGGVDTDPTPRAMTVAVTSVNDAPVGASNNLTTVLNTPYQLKAADFGFTDPNDTPANTLLAVKFTLLPSSGTLKDNGTAVTLNQFVSAADLSGGKLVFTPNTNLLGNSLFLCRFQVQDNGGTASGGIDTDPTPRKLTITVT